MKDPIKAEVWMRLDTADEMHRVGYITYEENDLDGGQVTLDRYSESVVDFLKAMNKVLAQRREDDDE